MCRGYPKICKIVMGWPQDLVLDDHIVHSVIFCNFHILAQFNSNCEPYYATQGFNFVCIAAAAELYMLNFTYNVHFSVKTLVSSKTQSTLLSFLQTLGLQFFLLDVTNRF